MSDKNTPSGTPADDDVWATLGLADEPGSVEGSDTPNHDDGGDFVADNHAHAADSHVVDVEETPKKPKSKVGIYVGVAIASVIVVAIVWAIVGKMMTVMSSNKGDEEVLNSTATVDIKPLEGSQAAAIHGGLAGQDQGATQHDQVPIDGNAQLPSSSASGPTLVAVPATPTTSGTSAPVANTAPATTVTSGNETRVPAAAGNLAAACPVVDTSEKDREISDLKTSLKTANDRIHELQAKQQATPAARPVAKTASKPRQSAAHVPTKNKAVRSKPGDVKEARESSAGAPEAGKPGHLSDYHLFAVYPNSGEHKAAHLVDPAGKNAVVRVGDKLRTGATVLKIDVEAWRVQTTDGDIR